MPTKVSVIRCENYQPQQVQEAVKKAVDLLGGAASIIKPGSKVLVKPNLLMAKEPELCITTHPEVVRAVIRMLKEINCRVIVGDGPSVWGKFIQDVSTVYEVTGIRKVCQDEGVELVRFDKKRWRGKFPLTTWLDECDYFVNVPKFKTHNLTLLSAAVKNLYGLVSGTFKTELHKQYFHDYEFAKIVADIYAQARPALNVVDAVMSMEGEGPGTAGTVRKTGIIVAGSDAVAIDTVLAQIMGVKPLDVLTTKETAGRKLGTTDMREIEVAGEELKSVIGSPFKLPSTSLVRKNIPKIVLTIAKHLIKYYPCVEYDRCIKCAACIRACPNKIISLKNNRISFDYSRCIACFCCQEVCPNSAIKTSKSLVAKLIGL